MRTFAVILILTVMAGCQSKTYKPADWKELPQGGSAHDGTEQRHPDTAQLNPFGELTDWNNPNARSATGGATRSGQSGNFSTLPDRTSRSHGTTLPSRSGTTLPTRSGTTLPQRYGTTLPQRDLYQRPFGGTTLPDRSRNTTTLPSR